MTMISSTILIFIENIVLLKKKYLNKNIKASLTLCHIAAQIAIFVLKFLEGTYLRNILKLDPISKISSNRKVSLY